MRILITEEAIQSGKGHWPSYIGDLAGEFRHAGDEVDVLVHREATEAVMAKVGGTRWFSRNCWVDAGSQGKLGGLVHNWYFYKETKRWLVSKPGYDWVLSLTMRLQHLLAFAALSRSGVIPKSTRFLLLFVQGFGQYQGPGKPTTFPNGMSNRLAKFAFRRLAPAVRQDRVVLAAETQGMRDELQRFTGLPVSLFPHPVHNRVNQGAQQEEAGSLKQSIGGNQPITVTCPGFGRHEKGTDLLQEAILQWQSRGETGKFHFILQWPEPFEMPGGGCLGADPKLVADSQVELVNENLDAAAYNALLDRSDFVILPYRRDSYHNRLSRVAIEAAGKGIPLIYTAHTWTGEVAELAGGGIRIEEESAEAIVAALAQVAANAPTLVAAARAHTTEVREFHSAASFRRFLGPSHLS